MAFWYKSMVAAKKLTLCLVFLFVACVQSLAQAPETKISGVRENVDYGEIEKIYFYISKTSENVDGYIVFLDNEGKLCSTRGVLTLSVKKKYIIGRSNAIPKPVEAVKEEVTYSKQLEFKPDDFKLLTLSSGGMIFALPIDLPPDKVAKGDTVVLEWQNFKTEQEIVAF